ncbi:WhiB family transcriptional regulator [Streptomyces sp. NPDC048516]|uniref:WhiB family transcriptional regulator n=1 Tax=Streptomyces sp. NPDC048516 TaxID=3365565 RepID=UPI00371F41E6
MIHFPRTDRVLACRNDPKAFAIEDIAGRAEREKALTKAKLACSGCPIVKNCLQGALANKQLTPTGVWVATTARQRTMLCKDLVRRLDDDRSAGSPHRNAASRKSSTRPALTRRPSTNRPWHGWSWNSSPADRPRTLDGFLDEPAMPGDNTMAWFRLIGSPTHDGTDAMVPPCSATDPVMAHAVLHDLAPGDQLRVTGYLHLPRTPTEPMFLVVTELRVLQSSLLLDDPASPALRLIATNHT